MVALFKICSNTLQSVSIVFTYSNSEFQLFMKNELCVAGKFAFGGVKELWQACDNM